MKRILCFVLTLLCILPLAACADVSPVPGLNSDIEGNADAVKALQDEIKSLKKDYDAKIKHLNSQIAALEDEEAAQNVKIEALEADKKKKAQEIAALKSELEALKTEYETRISELEEQLASTTAPEETSTESDSTTPENVTTEIETGTGPQNPHPSICPNSYVYKAYVRVNSDASTFYCEDFWVENASTDALSYAVYERNKSIEDLYNCRIRQYDSNGNQYDEMTRFYFNEEQYDLAILEATAAANCATTSLIRDVYPLENIDLEHATYDKNAIQEFTMGGKLYFFTGDMNISPLDSAALTIFNKTLFSKYDFVEVIGNPNYDDIYKMVSEGTWTISAMMEMAEVVNLDSATDGGTLVAADGDIVGYVSYSASPMYYWYGCGARISKLDVGGLPALSFGAYGSNSEALFGFLYDTFNRNVNGNSWIPNGGTAYRDGEFMSGRVLFTDVTIWNLRKTHHPMDKVWYGIVPTPKYNENQERYYASVYFPYHTVHLWTIPTMCKDIETGTELTNIISVYSNAIDGTMDAYFLKTLQLAVARDAGSRQSLRIIREALTYDIFLLYNWGGFISSLIEGLDTANSNQYNDYVTAANLDAAIADMELTLEKFKNPVEPDQMVAG